MTRKFKLSAIIFLMAICAISIYFSTGYTSIVAKADVATITHDNYDNTVFSSEVYIDNTSASGVIGINNSTFQERTKIVNCYGEINISNCTFNNGLYIEACQLGGKITLTNCVFGSAFICCEPNNVLAGQITLSGCFFPDDIQFPSDLTSTGNLYLMDGCYFTIRPHDYSNIVYPDGNKSGSTSYIWAKAKKKINNRYYITLQNGGSCHHAGEEVFDICSACYEKYVYVSPKCYKWSSYSVSSLEPTTLPLNDKYDMYIKNWYEDPALTILSECEEALSGMTYYAGWVRTINGVDYPVRFATLDLRGDDLDPDDFKDWGLSGISWEKVNGKLKLYLNNATIWTNPSESTLYLPANSEIILSGDNCISGPRNAGSGISCRAIQCDGDLTISGNGTLRAYTNTVGYGTAIYCNGDLTIEKDVILYTDAVKREGSGYHYGIYSNGDVIIYGESHISGTTMACKIKSGHSVSFPAEDYVNPTIKAGESQDSLEEIEPTAISGQQCLSITYDPYFEVGEQIGTAFFGIESTIYFPITAYNYERVTSVEGASGTSFMVEPDAMEMGEAFGYIMNGYEVIDGDAVPGYINTPNLIIKLVLPATTPQGSYSFNLLSDKYLTEDGTRILTSNTISFTVATLPVEIPEEDDTVFYYDGTDKTYYIPQSDDYSISGTTKKYAGTYTVTLSLYDPDNYAWVDGTTEPKTYSFVINKGLIAIPDPDPTTHIYNGEKQEYIITHNDELYIVRDNKKTEVGEYDVSLSIKDTNNYEWEDHTTDDKIYKFVIHKKQIAKPEQVQTPFYYNGDIQTYPIESSDYYSVSGNKKTYVGEYHIKITLNDFDTCEWEGYPSSAELDYLFVINKGQVKVPEADTSDFYYTGDELTYNITPNEQYTVKGNKQTSLGTYSVIISLSDPDNYEWETGGIRNVVYSFVIKRHKLVKPETDNMTVYYDGTQKICALPTSEHYIITGNVQTEVGNYTITVSIINTASYEWEDGTTDNIEYTFVVLKGVIDIPTADTTQFIYNGTEQTYALTLDDRYTITDNKQTNAGTYTVVVAIITPSCYEWADGSIEDIEYEFIINTAEMTNYVAPVPIEGLSYSGSDLILIEPGSVVGGFVEYSFDMEIWSTEIPTGLNAGSYAIFYNYIADSNHTPIEKDNMRRIYSIIAKTPIPVSFDSAEFIYDGTPKSITAVYPEVIKVHYIPEDTSRTEPGTTTIIAYFEADSKFDNYVLPESITATITILPIEISTYGFSSVIASAYCPSGFEKDVMLYLEDTTNSSSSQAYIPFSVGNKLSKMYTLSLRKDGVEVKSKSEMTIKIAIPDDAKGQEFVIYHIVDKVAYYLDYTVEGDSVVFSTTELSDFAFVLVNVPVNEGKNLLALYIGIASAIVVGAGIAIFALTHHKKVKF